MAKLDKKFAPFIKGAKQDYIQYCESLPDNIRRGKKVDRRVRYFDFLKMYYDGMTLYEIAEKAQVHPNSLRNTLAETQYKVEVFTKELTQA